MQNDFFAAAARRSSDDVIGELQSAVRGARSATALVVAWLAEVDRRQLALAHGYSSTFAYCTEALGFSEDEACNRIGAARASLRFPLILRLLECGDVTMTAVRLLQPHLTEDNHRAVLADAAGKTRREVETIVAALAPKPDVPTVVRKLPVVAPPAGSAPARVPAPAVVALSPERYKLQVTIGGEVLEKLELAQDMLRHAVPGADAAAVLERALDALLAQLARHRFAATDAPRASGATTNTSRHVPAAVRRAVWLRDRGRCAFVSVSGRRCNERGLVEFHHRHPHALGGGAAVDNISLRCRAHNQHEADVDFGRIRPGTDRRPTVPATC